MAKAHPMHPGSTYLQALFHNRHHHSSHKLCLGRTDLSRPSQNLRLIIKIKADPQFSTEGKAPGEAPVASDSGISAVGIERGTNQPGEKGDLGPPIESTIPDNLKETRGA